MSDDSTREVLRGFDVRVIDNPGRIVSTGLNAAIDASTGDIIVRMDAHTTYAPDYIRECVRALERSLARVLRKIAAKLASGQAQLPVTVGPGDLHGYLGHPRFTPESAERTAVPGVATGLADTGTGGDVLFIEASLADAETGSTGVPDPAARRRAAHLACVAAGSIVSSLLSPTISGFSARPWP